MKLPRPRLSYANVTATVALFVALGGSSYAALTLPRNSVGSAQIRTGAVHSSDVHDRSLRLRDLSLATRRELRGKTGATGPQGPVGPAGASAIRYFAAVGAGGDLVRGNATSASHTVSGSGAYTIGFAANVSACVYSATIGGTDATTQPAGRVSVRDAGGAVGVQTYDAACAPADLPFHLVVAC